MRIRSAVRAGCTFAVIGLAACMDEQPTTSPPVDVQGLAASKRATSDEVVRVDPKLARIDARLKAKGSNLRFARAEVIYAAKAYEAQSPTVIFANNRTHSNGFEWVSGDPRRDGRSSVIYAVDPQLQTFLTGLAFPVPVVETGAAFRLSSQTELDGYLEEAMQAWRDRKCSDAPFDRVAVPAGTDPDQLDDLFLGRPTPSANYLQPSDIVLAGWQPAEFFDAIIPGGSDAILGVAFSFNFVDDQGNSTDIDGNGKFDTGLVEIYFNPAFIWTNRGAPGFIDFFSVLTHEIGHSLGLGHFGKVFITKKDAADGLQIADLKYAPKALMNAVYVQGRDEIRGSDNGSFCQIWASKN